MFFIMIFKYLFLLKMIHYILVQILILIYMMAYYILKVKMTIKQELQVFVDLMKSFNFNKKLAYILHFVNNVIILLRIFLKIQPLLIYTHNNNLKFQDKILSVLIVLIHTSIEMTILWPYIFIINIVLIIYILIYNKIRQLHNNNRSIK